MLLCFWLLLLLSFCLLIRTPLDSGLTQLIQGDFISRSLNYIYKDPFSKEGHTHRSWGLGVGQIFCCCSVAESCPTLCDPTDRLQHARLLCPSPSPRACWNSHPLSWWCHPTISSSVVPFSSYLLSLPAPGSFSMNQLFASDGQSIGALALASVLPMNIQDLFPLELTGLITLQ